VMMKDFFFFFLFFGLFFARLGGEKGAGGRSGFQREGDLSRGGPVVDLFGVRKIVVLEIRGPADERIWSGRDQ